MGLFDSFKRQPVQNFAHETQSQKPEPEMPKETEVRPQS